MKKLFEKIKNWSTLKKSILLIITVFIFIGIITAIYLYVENLKQQNKDNNPPSIVEYKDLNELSNAIGFTLEVPDWASIVTEEEYEIRYSLIDKKIAQVECLFDDDRTGIVYRIAKQDNSLGQDISGNFRVYDNVYHNQGRLGATLHSDGEYFYLAIWSNASYIYSYYTVKGHNRSDLLLQIDTVKTF